MKVSVKLFSGRIVDFDVDYQGDATEYPRGYKIYKISKGVVELKDVKNPNNHNESYKFGWLNIFDNGDIHASQNIDGIPIGTLVN